MKILKVPQFGDELKNIPYRVNEKGNGVVFYEDGVQAGFPSPADDFKEQSLSLDERFLSKPNSTFIVKVQGESMYPTLHHGDLLIVRADENLTSNRIAIISVNNTDFTVKRFDTDKLIADNPGFPNIDLKEEDTLICFGVVMQLIREIS